MKNSDFCLPALKTSNKICNPTFNYMIHFNLNYNSQMPISINLIYRTQTPNKCEAMWFSRIIFSSISKWYRDNSWHFPRKHALFRLFTFILRSLDLYSSFLNSHIHIFPQISCALVTVRQRFIFIFAPYKIYIFFIPMWFQFELLFL